MAVLRRYRAIARARRDRADEWVGAGFNAGLGAGYWTGTVAGAGSVRLECGFAVEPAVSFRWLCDWEWKPVCDGSGTGGRGTAFEGIQPAVPVRRRGHGQEAPDACDWA